MRSTAAGAHRTGEHEGFSLHPGDRTAGRYASKRDGPTSRSTAPGNVEHVDRAPRHINDTRGPDQGARSPAATRRTSVGWLATWLYAERS